MMAVGRAMAEDANEGDLTDFLRNPLYGLTGGGTAVENLTQKVLVRREGV